MHVKDPSYLSWEWGTVSWSSSCISLHRMQVLNRAINVILTSQSIDNVWFHIRTVFILFFFRIILTSLFRTCRLYGDRQKPADGTQCPTLITDILNALSHRHDNTCYGLCWTSWQHWLEQVGDLQLESELSIWSKEKEESFRELSIPWSLTMVLSHFPPRIVL